jgi:hypothetical protein
MDRKTIHVTMSKALLLLPPILVLGLVVVFQASREKEVLPLPTGPAGVDTTTGPPPPKLDWNQAADEFSAGMPGGRVDETTAFGRVLRKIEAMTGPELLAAHEELAGTDLPPEARARFEPVLMGTLVRKDPELALQRFADHLRDPFGSTGALLLTGFREWAAKSPARAALWLDARAQDGAFDRPGEAVPPRVIYERELIRGLLATRREQADARLEALPEPWQGTALKGTETLQSQGAYAALVRKFLPEAEQRAEFLNMATAARYWEGAPGVAAFLDRIAATPAERELILRRQPTGTE